MATHSSVLAWRIPGMGEPGGLPSMGSHQEGFGPKREMRAWVGGCECVKEKKRERQGECVC